MVDGSWRIVWSWPQTSMYTPMCAHLCVPVHWIHTRTITYTHPHTYDILKLLSKTDSWGPFIVFFSFYYSFYYLEQFLNLNVLIVLFPSSKAFQIPSLPMQLEVLPQKTNTNLIEQQNLENKMQPPNVPNCNQTTTTTTKMHKTNYMLASCSWTWGLFWSGWCTQCHCIRENRFSRSEQVWQFNC